MVFVLKQFLQWIAVVLPKETVREKIQLYPLSNDCNTQHGPQAPLLLPEISVLQSTEMMSTGFALGLLAKTQTCIFKSLFLSHMKTFAPVSTPRCQKTTSSSFPCLIIDYVMIFDLHI